MKGEYDVAKRALMMILRETKTGENSEPSTDIVSRVRMMAWPTRQLHMEAANVATWCVDDVDSGCIRQTAVRKIFLLLWRSKGGQISICLQTQALRLQAARSLCRGRLVKSWSLVRGVETLRGPRKRAGPNR